MIKFQKERSSLLAAVLVGLTAFLGWTNVAAAESGQRTFAKIVVEPAVDDTTGGTIYLLTPEKSPLPAKSNESATASLYLPMYPLSSTVSAFDLNCLPTNCDHVNVLPFHFSGYDPLPASSPACAHFNGGQECSLVKGHDHLVAAAPTGGDFNVARQLKLVVFTSKAFGDGAIHTRVKTESQIRALVANGDAMIVDTPVIVHGAIASEHTYDLGTPVVIPFP